MKLIASQFKIKQKKQKKKREKDEKNDSHRQQEIEPSCYFGFSTVKKNPEQQTWPITGYK